MRVRALVSITLTLVLVIVQVSESNADIQKGKTCNQVGKIKQINNDFYKCSVKKGKRQWKLLKSTKDNSNASELDSIQIGMNKIADEVNYKQGDFGVQINYIAEPGNNGRYQSVIENLLPYSVAIMQEFAGRNPFTKINLLFGRTQDWLISNRNLICHESKHEVTAADSISPCKDGSGLIEINLPGVVTDKYLQADSKVDLSKVEVTPVVEEKIRNLAPHEYFHFWQGSLSLKSPPSWFSEGTAQVFSLVVRTKADTLKRDYSTIFNSWFTKDEIKWSQERCKSSISNVSYSMESQCQYLQGIIPVEVLLVEYGGIQTLRKLMETNSRLDFESAFFETTGQTLKSFYSRVDDYAVTKGWKSGR